MSYETLNGISLLKIGKSRKKSTRQIAIADGLTRYKGSPCKHNHDSLRWTGSGLCIECGRLNYVPTGRKKGRDPGERALAKERGDIYYFTGELCLRGHLAKRRTENGECQDCHALNYKKMARDYTLRAKYKINLLQYEEMFEAQNGVCKICEQPETAIDKSTKATKALSVDHCHDTLKIRGLLCHRCNVGIGSLMHNPNLIRKAALYCEATND